MNGEIKRSSTTFDNIKCLLREGLIDGLDESPPDFAPPNPPPISIVRVVSLPSIVPDETATTDKVAEQDAPNEAEEHSDPQTPEKREIGIQASVRRSNIIIIGEGFVWLHRSTKFILVLAYTTENIKFFLERCIKYCLGQFVCLWALGTANACHHFSARIC